MSFFHVFSFYAIPWYTLGQGNTIMLYHKKQSSVKTKESSDYNLKSLFLEWCEVTTCAGVIDGLMARTKVGKLFWAVFIIIGLVLTAWQTGIQIDDFLTGRFFESSVTIIPGTSIYFPNVTICNFNRIDKKLASSLSRLGLSYALIAANMGFNSIENDLDLSPFEKEYDVMMEKYNITDVKNLFHRYGISCDDTFVSCTWYMTSFECCESVTELITVHGRCWNLLPKFNSSTKNILKQTFPGPYSGLQFYVNPNVESCMEDLLLTNNCEQGIMIGIDYHRPVELHHFITVSPGTTARVALYATVNVYNIPHQPLRTAPCYMNPNLTYFDVEYSRSNCMSDCFADLLYNKAKCVFVGPLRSQYTICSPAQFMKFEQVYQGQSGYSEKKNLEECYGACNYPCSEYWSVKSSLSTSKSVGSNICSESLAKKLFQNRSVSNKTLDSLINVIVYFPELDHYLIETSERTPLFTLISNIGGQLSLWLGISLVTIIQLSCYICSCILIKVQ